MLLFVALFNGTDSNLSLTRTEIVSNMSKYGHLLSFRKTIFMFLSMLLLMSHPQGCFSCHIPLTFLEIVPWAAYK